MVTLAKVNNSNSRKKLLKELSRDYQSILNSFKYIDNEIRNNGEIIPAAEWLIDNLYLIEKEYKDIHHNISSGYLKTLPNQNNGVYKGYSRIYGIAEAFVEKCQGRVLEKNIPSFIDDYQTHEILTSGELWIFPIMIKICIIKSIREITEEIVWTQKEKKQGESIAERIIQAIDKNKIQEEIKNIDLENKKVSCHLMERMLKLLRNNDSENTIVVKWINEKLASMDISEDEMIRQEHGKQADFRIHLGNCIMGIREVEGISWQEYFEILSCVEKILKKDPANIYSKMDFESRDYYRHCIEKIALETHCKEIDVANIAVKNAEKARELGEPEFKTHIGYYIIDEGKKKIVKELLIKKSIYYKFIHCTIKNNPKIYVAGIISSSLFVSAIFALISYGTDRSFSTWIYVVSALAVIIPISEIIISILNWSININSTPRFVPKLELENGIPKEYSTIVIIPTIINDENRVKEIVNELEVYYLANMETNLYFAILGDFKDSQSKQEENDKNIIETAIEEINMINKKYKGDNGQDIFYFFNRYRQFNEKENRWMGWERKRGKIMEFNAMLLGDTNTSYDILSGDISCLKNAKYIITLDADTQLPRGSAKKLIGAMMHILNVPVIEKDKKKIIRGYGLMQPRISVGTLSANKTLFSRIFSGETGIDIYTTAVSDVYQDIFGEGIYTGKGIYDIEIFNEILKGKITENSVLSHDLLEGSLVRTALVSDIELVDGYPPHYIAAAKRLHRWVRGDWQLVPWIKKRNELNLLSRWKIVDNLRRSLLFPSILVLIFLSITILPTPNLWLVIGFISISCPLLFNFSDAIVCGRKASNIETVIEQVFLIFCFLLHRAWLMVDAIIRTIYRLTISKKNLLNWQTAADVEACSGKEFKDYFKFMRLGMTTSVVIFIVSLIRSEKLALVILPSCILWFLSPLIAYSVGKKQRIHEENFTEEEKVMLRRISRETWGYFEDFTCMDTNWLAPDNYQENPPNGVAYRISPTNMGMNIISNSVAFDFGYIGILEMCQRFENILANMDELARFQGHFYNWYDIKSKKPLEPRYISTVDSGNLVGYLWTSAVALKDSKQVPFISDLKTKGLLDTLLLAENEIRKECAQNNFYQDIISKINNTIGKITLLQWKNILDSLLNNISVAKNNSSKELYWNNKLKNNVVTYLRELQNIFPWTNSILSVPIGMNFNENVLNDLSVVLCINNYRCEIENIITEINGMNTTDEKQEQWKRQMLKELKDGISKCEELNYRIENIVARINDMANSQDFKVLFDCKKKLFAIGYDIEKDSIGDSYYDLLASEARQASFIAIAKGDVDKVHWFKLGRAMTSMGKNRKGLVSWSGTMFEYFMPLLIMKSYRNTLLSETYISVIKGQKKYCNEKKVPWGISESAYYGFDINKNYQYKAFGIPGIGLKRGLKNELVISPYSTVLALQLDKSGAIKNMKRLIEEKLEGRYGFYEAVDYSKERISSSKKKAIVKSFMVHHEGMSLMALNNVINDNILQKRFHSLPQVKATELLLQEKVPSKVIYNREQNLEISENKFEINNSIVRGYSTATTDMPESQLLSNGSYNLMITNSGSGYGKKDDMSIYRWRRDDTNDCYGMFIFVKNINSNDYWSTAYMPCKDQGEDYKVTFFLDKVEFKRRDGNITTTTNITVSSEDDVEVRKVSITNHSKSKRIIEITSYCEVTLCTEGADLIHPAFSNLFIRTEYLENPICIIANRRPRSTNEKPQWMMQTVAVDGQLLGSPQFETSREAFIGRGRNISKPLAQDSDMPLKNTVGAVLDPIISIRIRILVPPGKTVKTAFSTGVSESREEVCKIATKYSIMQNVNRAFEMAWTQNNVDMKYIGIRPAAANLYQLMASKIIHLCTQMRSREEFIKNISKHQCDLWVYGMSGDIPIVLFTIKQEKHVEMLKQMINAHEYWYRKGLKTDLVILNLQQNSYMQSLNHTINEVIFSGVSREKINVSGGIFVLNNSSINKGYFDFFMSIAALVIEGDKGSIINQIKEIYNSKNEGVEISKIKNDYTTESLNFKKENLCLYNGFGGFDEKNREYVIYLKGGDNTPAPWINVLSNGEFGFNISESGSAYTWCENSRENKITPWFNDPVTDPVGEGIYIRDEDSGDIWNISKKPIDDNGEYEIHHGIGYSIFKHNAYGINGEVTTFVPKNDNVKISIIKLKNTTLVKRNISVTYYAQMVLGVIPQHTEQYISTYINIENKYIYSRNPYSTQFGNLYAYLKVVGGQEYSYTGDRKEFIGRNGSLSYPEGLKYKELSNNCGAGLDPSMVENAKSSISPGEEKVFVCLMGEEENLENIEAVINKYSNKANVNSGLKELQKYWDDLLGTVNVSTPDTSVNLMLNTWLPYQIISCRLWSRSGFYQSGGAFGFRDQLQDVMSLCILNPEFTKKQILYSASREYLEGDVQHWWHPYVESGIRTRFSDDSLWLPYVTAEYINITGDYSILEEKVSYLKEEPLKEGEDEKYCISCISQKKGSIYEHCIKAIDKRLVFGAHNLPLMGSGDWNDGMNTVGNKGKGESVWLGWFLYSIVEKFIKLTLEKKDYEKHTKYKEMQKFLIENIEKYGWDGSWYKRAYFDNGEPLGSAENDECRIDSISQSWAVISGGAKESRAREAIDALEKHLVRKEKNIILLLNPPFDKSHLEPGYIKSYVPGVRENGGQYTHSAVWAVIAAAKLGEEKRAWKMFNMINPINHTNTRLECEMYRVEPYVMAADVYNIYPNEGRGGWTWYTGAAGWMYTAGVQWLLGLKIKDGKSIVMKPCIPEEWNEYNIKYTKGKAIYNILVKKHALVERGVTVDGKFIEGNEIPIFGEGVHEVTVII